MLFAEVDQTAFWTAIITTLCVGVGSVVTTIVGMVLSYKRETAATAARAEAAERIAQVGRDLKENTLHVNSMKDQLVAAVAGQNRAEGKEEGVKSEQDRVGAQETKTKELAKVIREKNSLEGAPAAIAAVMETEVKTGAADDAAKEAASLAEKLHVATAKVTEAKER